MQTADSIPDLTRDQLGSESVQGGYKASSKLLVSRHTQQASPISVHRSPLIRRSISSKLDFSSISGRPGRAGAGFLTSPRPRLTSASASPDSKLVGFAVSELLPVGFCWFGGEF